jgi:8-oxo-dGTP pyrophosphatase MutT (NUDIX family)
MPAAEPDHEVDPDVGPEVDLDFGEWREVDGVWFRRAARVIAADDDARVLLLRGFDPAEPSRVWWFTPGGGLAPGEAERDGAARELFEETGLRVPPDGLVGPVAARSATFPFLGRVCRQDEVLFFAQIASGQAFNTDGWTGIERASMTDVRWWRLDELATTSEVVYPPALRDLVADLLANGWDGVTRDID